MMKRQFKLASYALAGIMLCAVPDASRANPIAGTIATGVVLDHAETKAKNVIKSAKDAGDFLIWRAAEEALRLLQAWKETHIELLNHAFGKLDKATRDMFNEIDSTLDRVSKERELAVKDAERLTLQWSQTIKSLPIVSKNAEVYSYSPRVLLPNGEDKIAVKVYGPKLADAKPEVQLPDNSKVKPRLRTY